MIELTTVLWIAAGLGVGIVHASILWRATSRLSAWTPVWGILRLSFVASVLVLSALSGLILYSTAGWAVGLVLTGGWLVARSGKQATASIQIHSPSE